jgi:RND family efflux transporter MFP subunit
VRPKKAITKMKITSVGSIFLSVLLFSCTPNNSNTREELRKFSTITPIIKDTAYISEYVAAINAFHHVEIRTKMRGYIEHVHVDEGQNVRKGDVLFTINNKQLQQEAITYEAIARSAEAELRAAEIELKGAGKLLDENYISPSEYALTLANVETLKAKLEEAKSGKHLAKLNLSYTWVKAPFDGIINRIPHKMGSLLEEGTLLTTLSNTKEMLVYFNLSEREYLTYSLTAHDRKQEEIALVLANGVSYSHTGIIETTESEFDKSTGTIAFRARFPNPENVLKHGSSGKVQVRTIIQDAVLIPHKPTFERQEQLCVFVVNNDSLVELRRITPAKRLSRLFIIDNGLQQGDRIIYEGVQLVREGDKVEPLPVALHHYLTD